jgi:invasion protein IalB
MAFAPKSNRVFRAAFTGLMLAGGLGLATQADAQQAGKVKSSHGAWSVVCDTPAGAPGEQCALMQNVIADDRPEVGLSVVVLKTADQQARILRVLAPLGVLLPSGLGLNVDGKDIGRAYFVRCFSDGCYAEVILDETLLDHAARRHHRPPSSSSRRRKKASASRSIWQALPMATRRCRRTAPRFTPCPERDSVRP